MSLEARVDNLERFKDEADERLRRIEHTLLHTHMTVEGNQFILHDIKSRLSTLETGFSAFEARFSTLETRFSALETRFSVLESDTSEIKSDMAEAKSILQQLSHRFIES